MKGRSSQSIAKKNSKRGRVVAQKTPGESVRRGSGAFSYSDLLSIVVFAAGVGGVLAVMYLGYQRYFVSVGVDENVAAVLQQEDNGAAIVSVASQDAIRVDVKNLRGISKNDAQGVWMMRDGQNQAYADFQDTSFTIVFIADPKAKRRYFSSGTYSFDPNSGVMTLSANSQAQPPQKPADVEYQFLTTRTYKVLVKKDRAQNLLMWLPHKEGRGRDQVHPVFTYLGRADSFIGWTSAQ